MHRQFEHELDEIKKAILTMAGLVEKSLEEATTALVERDADLAERVIEGDDQVDRCELLIDRLTTDFMALYQPAASDLRFVMVAIKLAPELERMADNAVNIAERARQLAGQPLLKPLIDLPRMLAQAQAMVSDAIAAYVARDASAARQIIRRDDTVDALYLQVFRELLTYMIEDPRTITRALDLLFVARFAERIADQATNIAEEVVYLVEGRQIRHQRWED